MTTITTPANSLPLQVITTKADNFTSGSLISLWWKSTDSSNCTQWSPMLFLNILSSDNDAQSKKINVWYRAPVASAESSLVLPRISDHKQNVHIDLWCSHINVHLVFHCGTSPQFTLLPNTNKQSNKDTNKNTVANNDLPKVLWSPVPPPPSATGDSCSRLQAMAVPATTDTPLKKTKISDACRENVPDPLCVPIMPSFIGYPPLDSTILPEPTSDPSNKESRVAGGEWMDGGAIAVIVIFSVIIFTVFSCWLNTRLRRKQRQKKVVGTYTGGSSGYDPGYRSTRPLSSSASNSHSHSPYSPQMRENRIIPPWSLSYMGPPSNSGSNNEEPFGGGRAGEERDGQAPSPGPPYHISCPILAEEPGFLEQCTEALKLPYNHAPTVVVSEEGSARPESSSSVGSSSYSHTYTSEIVAAGPSRATSGSSVTSRLYNYTRTSATVASGCSRSTSPFSVSSRYSAMSPGGTVAMQTANADTRSRLAVTQAPWPRTLSQTDSISSPSTTEFFHRRVPSPISTRAPRYRPTSAPSELSSPSHCSTVSTYSMGDPSPYEDGSLSPTPSPTRHQLCHPSFQVHTPLSLNPQCLNKNNKYTNSHSGSDVHHHQNSNNYQIAAPTAATLTHTYLQAPIRSVMTISSEDGQVLSRNEVFIRMEANPSLDRYHESRQYEQQRRHQRQHILRTQETHQDYSSYSRSRRGLLHQGGFFQSSDDVPPTPAIPEKYMRASSTMATISPSQPLSLPVWSSIQQSSKQIGYDPNWTNTESSESEEARYGGRSRRMSSVTMTEDDVSRLRGQANMANTASFGNNQQSVSHGNGGGGSMSLVSEQVPIVQPERVYGGRGKAPLAQYI